MTEEEEQEEEQDKPQYLGFRIKTWNISGLSVYGLVNTVKLVLKQANKVNQTNNQTGDM